MGKILAFLGLGALLSPLLLAVTVALTINPAVTAASAGLICLNAPPPSAGGTPIVPETTRVVMPVPAGRSTITDGFGWREDPFTGERRFHYGTDLAGADGTALLAAADGIVSQVSNGGGFGNLIVLTHTVDGQLVTTGYGHMWDDGVYVREGQRVQAGQLIGAMGSNGYSTGSHMHFEVHLGPWSSPAVDALPWLAAHGAIALDDAGLAAACLPTPSPTPTPTPTLAGVG
jgi:murein DD-endopeptidase MepM/ murein hydrolase activator NlpD